MDVFIKASEYMEIPVRRSDDEPLQKLFFAVRSELNLDLKNMKSEQAKFWKQHPVLVKVCAFSLLILKTVFGSYMFLALIFFLYQTELLIHAQLARESALLSPALERDFKRLLELAPRLLEELVKVCKLSLELSLTDL